MMTENKRFTVHIGWYNYDKTDGEIELKDNGQPILLSESIEDVQLIKRLLNELSDENVQLRHDATVLIQANTDYRKENEQLKKKNEIAINGLTFCQEKNADLELRNNRQAERLKEVWDLIFDRNWEELEKKAIEMEENEKLLQTEYGDVE